MSWLPLAILTAVAFGLYNVFIKVSSDRIDQVLGAVVLQLVALLLGGAYLAFLRAGGKQFHVTSSGLLAAVAAGAAVGIAEILTFFVFGRGAPASLGSPIIMGGSVLVAAVIGILVLREGLGIWQIAGVVLIVAGIALISGGGRS